MKRFLLCIIISVVFLSSLFSACSAVKASETSLDIDNTTEKPIELLIKPEETKTTAVETETEHTEEEIRKLSSFTDKELKDFMIQYAIVPRLPSYPEGELLNAVKSMVLSLEDNPDGGLAYSAAETLIIAECVAKAVRAYYGWEWKSIAFEYTCGQTFVRDVALKQNSVYLTDDQYYGVPNYTAILGGSTIVASPSSFLEYAPGGVTEMTAWKVAETITDRMNRGKKYQVVSISEGQPVYSDLAEGQSVMCVRVGVGADLADAHFMMLTEDGWIHKPGFSNAFLLFDGVPDTSVEWVSEMSFDNKYFYRGPIVYSGPIVYIIFEKKS